MSVLAVPRSIDRSLEKYPRKRLNMKRPENRRRGADEVARNLATDGTFSKATCMILRGFSHFQRTRR
jgi:hypothetical protein